MKKFNIYTHTERKTEAIKEGFSWGAFIFEFWWAIFSKLWLYAAAMLFSKILFFMAFVFMGFQQEASDGPAWLFWNVSFALYFGLNGNSWKEKLLEKKGYKLQKTVEAKNSYEAINGSVKWSQEK